MKFALWNVNGLRAISKKEVHPDISFLQFISKYDIVVLNETKIGKDQIQNHPNLIPNNFYEFHSHSTVRLGYSGVSILTKIKPIKRIEPPFQDNEGRIVILEYDAFILVGVYVPNAGPVNKETQKPKRHSYRITNWDSKFRNMCIELEKKKSLVIMGDLNVAYADIDVYAPTKLHKQAGFTSEERNNFKLLLESTSLIDAWRQKHPDLVKFSYFDYRSKARQRNAGWRIDYILVSNNLYERIQSCSILSHIVGSDHLPISFTLI